MIFSSVNPCDGSVLFQFPEDPDEVVRRILQSLPEANEAWSATSIGERASLLVRVAETLESQADTAAELMAMEMGKPVRQGRAEIKKCAWVCRYYAEQAPAFLAPEEFSLDSSQAEILCRPLGTVLAVMPWNFPFWQVFRFAAPALMAGNTVILKHAPNVLQCARSLTEWIHQSGIPRHVFQQVILSHDRTADLMAHPDISAVTLTGSTRAGKEVAAQAGRNLKKCVLELGGSDPYLILEDADVALAARMCAQSRMLNAGQSCIAAKRFLVAAGVYASFLDAFLEELKSYTPDHPMSDDTPLGPLARRDLQEHLHTQVRRSLDEGAVRTCGGELPASPGWFYPATVLESVRPGMPAFDEELFGPVAALIRVRDEEEAIRLANQSVYGLGGAIFSRDLDRATRIARDRLQVGSVAINDFVKSDPRLPFGGIRQSGYGRELGRAGIREFINLKTIVAAGPGTTETKPNEKP